jgi:hypothetical protein
MSYVILPVFTEKLQVVKAETINLWLIRDEDLINCLQKRGKGCGTRGLKGKGEGGKGK